MQACTSAYASGAKIKILIVVYVAHTYAHTTYIDIYIIFNAIAREVHEQVTAK